MNFIPIDPEEADKARRHLQEIAGRSDLAIHSIVRLVDELPEVELEALGALIANISNSRKRSVEVASYWQGIIVGRLSSRFGHCSGCGQNHDKDLEEMSGQDVNASTSSQLMSVAEQEPLFRPGEVIFTPLGSIEPLNDPERKIADNHNIDDLRNFEGNELLGFICKFCGHTYTTIQDRMLRPPGKEAAPDAYILRSGDES